MTSYYYNPLFCESIFRYPYISKVSIKEKNPVDFIYQFVKDGVRDSVRNIDTVSTARYISGAPTKFPKYGDFPETFIMRTYKFDISISSRHANDTIMDSGPNLPFGDITDINCVQFKFHEAVYPIRVSIFEVYNPGNIIKIWAHNSEKHLRDVITNRHDSINNDYWFLLWEGLPQIVPPTSRLFSPPLESCNFKTDMLRLEFKPSVFDYTKLDAVMLIGTSELILPRNPEESLTSLLKSINCNCSHHEDVHNLTADYENAHLDIDHLQKNFPEHCIICKSEKEEVFHNTNYGQREVLDYALEIMYPKHSQGLLPEMRLSPKHNQKLLDFPSAAKHGKLSPDESKGLSRCSLSALPDEIIVKILKNLDLKTLCLMNKMNKRFYNLTQDPRLYTQLNMRNICCTMYIHNIFCYFTPRCKYLLQLDLTLSKFSSLSFVQFLVDCGSNLKRLRLKFSRSVDNNVILKISEICKNLKELDLTRCTKIKSQGFLHLQNLESLKHLRLGHTNIEVESLCKILQKNPLMRELDLQCTIKGYNNIMSLDSIAIELRNSCRGLEIINLHQTAGAGSISSQAVNALADCKNLRKVNLGNGWEIFDAYVNVDSLSRLLSSCERLEEIRLAHTVITECSLKLLTQCKNLEHLHLDRVKFVTPDNFPIIIEQCPKLRKFCLLNCNISCDLTNQWEKSHPHVLQTFFSDCSRLKFFDTTQRIASLSDRKVYPS